MDWELSESNIHGSVLVIRGPSLTEEDDLQVSPWDVKLIVDCIKYLKVDEFDLEEDEFDYIFRSGDLIYRLVRFYDNDTYVWIREIELGDKGRIDKTGMTGSQHRELVDKFMKLVWIT